MECGATGRRETALSQEGKEGGPGGGVSGVCILTETGRRRWCNKNDKRANKQGKGRGMERLQEGGQAGTAGGSLMNQDEHHRGKVLDKHRRSVHPID